MPSFKIVLYLLAILQTGYLVTRKPGNITPAVSFEIQTTLNFVIRLIHACFAQKNEILFEKIECDTDKNVCPNKTCYMRQMPVARGRYNIFFKCDLTNPLKESHVHLVLNYRYNIYRTFLVDRWEDCCEFSSGKSPSLMLDVLFKILGPYSNVNHTCPYTESIICSLMNYSSTDFIIEPLLPAGRYRFDADVAQSRNGTPFMAVKFYFSVSDYRIWH